MTDKDKDVLVGLPTRGDAYISKTVVEVVGLRDQFAIAALSVLRELHPAQLRWKDVALTAYELADAMMEARK